MFNRVKKVLPGEHGRIFLFLENMAVRLRSPEILSSMVGAAVAPALTEHLKAFIGGKRIIRKAT